MKLKSLNIYSFHVRAKTDWLILELISTEDIKGYSEITMSNYDQRTALISNVKKLIKVLSKIIDEDIPYGFSVDDLFNYYISGNKVICPLTRRHLRYYELFNINLIEKDYLNANSYLDSVIILTDNSSKTFFTLNKKRFSWDWPGGYNRVLAGNF